MTSEPFFRTAFSILWILFFTNVALVKYSSRKCSNNQPVDRTSRREGRFRIADVFLVLFAPFWLGGVALYAILPDWIAFLSIPLPDWFRVIMVVAGLLSIAFTVWGHRALEKNLVHALEPSIFRQREEDALVITGPYRYIRNPIYLGTFA